jgi:hypothetical protein
MPFPFWWWRRVRKAAIPKAERDIFERYGEIVIGSVLTSGLAPQMPELRLLHGDANPALKEHARDWLTERGDSREQQEQRLETAEWLIILLILPGAITECGHLIRYFCSLLVK